LKKEDINFTAIDFETANGKMNSICQIGLVRVEHGEIVKEIDHLVQPPDNDYHWGNVRVHGIKKEQTAYVPTFDFFWPEIEPYISHETVVAHNAQFDTKCLKETLKYYNLDVPFFKSQCTVKIYKRNLRFLADLYNIPLTHHNALSDARACALLYLMHLNEAK
jgi:DNA polymerase-3 subunit epsilon